ncbi:DHA2 family efflux MFS transporter permease subunit [Verminephrobacter aporrectodeae]|uniref:DHA2 family efflux MFS transporter permease subunit n=1 Tax=Verminephrobacter aporrectodeae TaxID=1110389 RepID=UPI0022448ACF|nr:DHA2 family efflux MFS transporter permease subunit [Verminephrobacter aporrectodeae]MCW8175307.1 DHA2 family efflux MFS transporter permease subunit [Verminephrobacter aporrectodeae subsp. tuberculatae]MCW8202792.1 DHA2 family efflux MFS transporter permease subunit [Verminephrobacter aporrectodeae subsp. tuberculatae]
MAQTELLRGPPMTGTNKFVATASIMLATILTGLDSTIANVALPQMQRSFGVSQDAAMLVITSYIVAAAIATPLIGWLSSRMGRQRLYLTAIAGFTMASVWCALSASLTEIVVARVVQGCFGAALIPLSQALILDINPPDRQAQALAQWGAGVMLGPILGPVLGGLLTEYRGWQWIFYINIPVGLIAFTGIATRVLRTAPEPARSFDLVGFVSLSLTIGLLQLVLDTGQHVGWLDSMMIVCALIVMTSAFVVFVKHTMRSDAGGFFNRALLADRNYVSGLFFTAAVGVLLFSTRALLPQLLVNVSGYTIAAAGVLMAPTGVGTLAAMLFAGKIIRRVDPRLMMISGFVVTGAAILQLVLLSMPVQETSIVVSGLVLGAGLGLIFAPLNAITFSTLDAGMRSDGAAFFALARNFGSSAGVSLMQSLLTYRTKANLVDHDATQAAFLAYLFDFRLLLILNLGAIPLLLFMRYRRLRPPDTR